MSQQWDQSCTYVIFGVVVIDFVKLERDKKQRNGEQ